MSPVARLLPYTVLIAVCHPSVDITINSPQPPPATLAILVTEREAVCVFCHRTHALLYFHQTLSIKSCVDDSTRSTLDPTIHTVRPSHIQTSYCSTHSHQRSCAPACSIYIIFINIKFFNLKPPFCHSLLSFSSKLKA